MWQPSSQPCGNRSVMWRERPDKIPQHLVWRATPGYFTNSLDSRAFRQFPIFLLQEQCSAHFAGFLWWLYIQDNWKSVLWSGISNSDSGCVSPRMHWALTGLCLGCRAHMEPGRWTQEILSATLASKPLLTIKFIFMLWTQWTMELSWNTRERKGEEQYSQITISFPVYPHNGISGWELIRPRLLCQNGWHHELGAKQTLLQAASVRYFVIIR